MQLTTISGKSPLAAAVRYALSRMERLRPYLDHGILELDNNAAERGMRAIALGRKSLPLHRLGGGRQGHRHRLHPDRASQAQRRRSPRLARRSIARIPDYKITKVDDLMPWRWNG